jgi:hypothetical protein
MLLKQFLKTSNDSFLLFIAERNVTIANIGQNIPNSQEIRSRKTFLKILG